LAALLFHLNTSTITNGLSYGGATTTTMIEARIVLNTVGCLREGLVFKANAKERISFKAVSNLYLEKVKE